jgi:signal transduction histidine kinase
MRERLRQIGGRLDIESSHQGTTVTASAPLQHDGMNPV